MQFEVTVMTEGPEEYVVHLIDNANRQDITLTPHADEDSAQEDAQAIRDFVNAVNSRYHL